MPYYISQIHIDWHVDTTPEALLPVIAQGHQDLDSTDHTLDTFEAGLAKLAAAHPELVVDALIDDGFNAFALLCARNGDVTTIGVEERPEGAAGPVELPYDDLPQLVGDADFETYYDSEADLRDAIKHIAGSGGCVATVGNDRFVVEVTAQGATATKLVIVTEPALVARLLAGNYAPPPRAGRDPSQKYSVALYWPEAMLQFIQQHATRADRSLSYIVQYAFKLARAKIAASTRDELHVTNALAGGDKRKQTLYFPGTMLDDIEVQAMRLDSSQSFVAQVAVSLARKDIEALPTVDEFPGDAD